MTRSSLNRYRLLLVFVGVSSVFWFKSSWFFRPTFVVLSTDKTTYGHDEFVTVTLNADPRSTEKIRKSGHSLSVGVDREGKPVTSIGNLKQVPLTYNNNCFYGRWPIPWNAPDGNYTLSLELPPDFPDVKKQAFKILSRIFDPLPPGFGAITLEGHRSLFGIPGPDQVKSIGGMPEWATFMGADALLVQGAQSNGADGKLTHDNPWRTQSLDGIKALGKECHSRHLKLGVYLLAFMVGGPAKNIPPRYRYGFHYSQGKIVSGLELPRFRGVSIADPQRPKDIATQLRKFQAMEEVDFVGLDYIRPAFGGNELVDDFVRDMPGVQTPARWPKMSPDDRMKWIAKDRWLPMSMEGVTNPEHILSEQWFWYRAHRTAQVLREIKKELGESPFGGNPLGGKPLGGKPLGGKPLWAFTLSWQKGWEHGQDPVMFRDAGVDMNGIMLYECTRKMFDGLVSQWGRYSQRNQLNLFLGNTFDWPLHQKTLRPAGPEEMMNRLLTALQNFHTDKKPVRGLFLHDIHRALVGRKGPYSTVEWMLAGGAALTQLRVLHQVLPYTLDLTVPTSVLTGDVQEAKLSFGSKGSEDPVRIKIYSSPDVEVWPGGMIFNSPTSFHFRWTRDPASAIRGDRPFVAIRAERPGKPHERCQIYIRYFQGT
jgi:hypothetical protein